MLEQRIVNKNVKCLIKRMLINSFHREIDVLLHNSTKKDINIHMQPFLHILLFSNLIQILLLPCYIKLDFHGSKDKRFHLFDWWEPTSQTFSLFTTSQTKSRREALEVNDLYWQLISMSSYMEKMVVNMCALLTSTS